MAKPYFRDRRRNYFIKKEFQTKFILKFCTLVALTALISAFVVYRFSSQSVSTVFENSRLIIKPGTEFIRPGLIMSSLISVIIVGIATVIVVLFISHRIAGPLYKFEDSLEKLGSGDVGFDIRFRRKDQMKRLADIFNTASQSLNNLIDGIKTESNQLDSIIKELSNSIAKLPQEEQRDLEEIIERLKEIQSHLENKLNKFTLR